MTETERILAGIEGGRELIEWFGGQVMFGDAGIVELQLVHDLPQLDGEKWKHARLVFRLKDVADVRLEGWSHQNVIGGLQIREAPKSIGIPVCWELALPSRII